MKDNFTDSEIDSFDATDGKLTGEFTKTVYHHFTGKVKEHGSTRVMAYLKWSKRKYHTWQQSMNIEKKHNKIKDFQLPGEIRFDNAKPKKIDLDICNAPKPQYLYGDEYTMRVEINEMQEYDLEHYKKDTSKKTEVLIWREHYVDGNRLWREDHSKNWKEWFTPSGDVYKSCEIETAFEKLYREEGIELPA